MPRSFAVDSIVLPRLIAIGGLALGKLLIAAAELYKNPQSSPKLSPTA